MQLSKKNYYLTLWLCIIFGVVGGHLFYLERYRDGFIRILLTLMLVGYILWLVDLFKLMFGNFVDANGDPLPKYWQWFKNSAYGKHTLGLWHKGQSDFKVSLSELKQSGREFKKAGRELKAIFNPKQKTSLQPVNQEKENAQQANDVKKEGIRPTSKDFFDDI